MVTFGGTFITCDVLWSGAKRIVLGQLLAFVMSCTGVFTSLLVRDDQSYALLQAGTAYAMIAMLFCPIYVAVLWRHYVRDIRYANFSIGTALWRYALIGLVDLEANYFVVLAYKYTDMTSVQLLDCFTIPCVMALSYLFLGTRFSKIQLAGCAIAIAGLCLLVYLDADGLSRSTAGSHALSGDLLCLLSCACYAISNVACERLIKRDRFGKEDPKVRTENALTPEFHSLPVLSRYESSSDSPTTKSSAPSGVAIAPQYLPILEYLGVMPVFALGFCVIQFFLLEYSDVRSQTGWSSNDTVYQALFGGSMVFVYAGMPSLFFIASATFANLSLLTADIYSIIWNVAVFAIYPKVEFFAAYVIIVGGISIYDTNGFHTLRQRMSYQPVEDSRQGVDGGQLPAVTPAQCGQGSGEATDPTT